MNVTQRLIDEVKIGTGLESDYALANLLEVSRSTVSNWRTGRSQMDETAAIQVAEILELDPLAVLGALALERPHTERQAEVWGRYVGREPEAA